MLVLTTRAHIAMVSLSVITVLSLTVCATGKSNHCWGLHCDRATHHIPCRTMTNLCVCGCAVAVLCTVGTASSLPPKNRACGRWLGVCGQHQDCFVVHPGTCCNFTLLDRYKLTSIEKISASDNKIYFVKP